jgi:hypothetical protein
MWVEGVSCQKFQQVKQLARLFEISLPHNEGTPCGASDKINGINDS